MKIRDLNVEVANFTMKFTPAPPGKHFFVKIGNFACLQRILMTLCMFTKFDMSYGEVVFQLMRKILEIVDIA